MQNSLETVLGQSTDQELFDEMGKRFDAYLCVVRRKTTDTDNVLFTEYGCKGDWSEVLGLSEFAHRLIRLRFDAALGNDDS